MPKTPCCKTPLKLVRKIVACVWTRPKSRQPNIIGSHTVSDTKYLFSQRKDNVHLLDPSGGQIRIFYIRNWYQTIWSTFFHTEVFNSLECNIRLIRNGEADEAFLDEGMKEVLVYLELTLMSHQHVDQEKVLLRLKWIWREAIPA